MVIRPEVAFDARLEVVFLVLPLTMRPKFEGGVGGLDHVGLERRDKDGWQNAAYGRFEFRKCGKCVWQA